MLSYNLVEGRTNRLTFLVVDNDAVQQGHGMIGRSVHEQLVFQERKGVVDRSIHDLGDSIRTTNDIAALASPLIKGIHQLPHRFLNFMQVNVAIHDVVSAPEL